MKTALSALIFLGVLTGASSMRPAISAADPGRIWFSHWRAREVVVSYKASSGPVHYIGVLEFSGNKEKPETCVAYETFLKCPAKEYDQVEVGDIIGCDRYVLEHSRMGTLDPGDIKANRGNWEQYPDDPFYKMMERYEAQTAQSPSPP